MPLTVPPVASVPLYARHKVTGETFLVGPSTSMIDDLGDVDTSTTGPTGGSALVWDDTLQQWVPGSPAASEVEVDAVEPTGDWELWVDTSALAAPKPPVGTVALDDLTDVDTTTTAPADGQALVFTTATGQWVPSVNLVQLRTDVDTMTLGHLDDVDLETRDVPHEGEVLTFDDVAKTWVSKPPAPPASGASTTVNVGPNEAYAISSLPYNRGAAFSVSVVMQSGAASQVFSGMAMVREEAGVGYMGHIWMDQEAWITAKLLSKIGIARANSDQAGFVLYVRSSGARTLICDISARSGTADFSKGMEYTVPTSGIVEIDLA